MEYSFERTWRDTEATERLGGDWLGKTHSTLLDPKTFRSIREGWLYIGSDSLVYVGDGAIFAGTLHPTNADRILHATYEDLGTTKLEAPFYAPNGIVTFSRGVVRRFQGGEARYDVVLQGQKRQMKLLHKLAG